MITLNDIINDLPLEIVCDILQYNPLADLGNNKLGIFCDMLFLNYQPVIIRKSEYSLNSQRIFVLVCRHGILFMCQIIYHLYNVNINDANNYIFRMTIKENKCDVSKWIYGISCTENNKKINLNDTIFGNNLFTWLCINGNTNMCRWFINNNYIIANYETLFFEACYNNNFETTLFIYNLAQKNNYHLDINTFYCKLFSKLWLIGNMEFIDWLWALKKTHYIHYEVSHHLDKYMDSAVETGKSHLIRWLIDKKIIISKDLIDKFYEFSLA